jgi:hypothetical protein
MLMTKPMTTIMTTITTELGATAIAAGGEQSGAG